MKVTVVYTMKGCPHCTHIKEELKKSDIPYIERDIDEFSEEYDEFAKITENEYVPALMLLTLDENDEPYNIKLLAPERDYQDVFEGVNMVKDHLSE
jgi:glutaredoxin